MLARRGWSIGLSLLLGAVLSLLAAPQRAPSQATASVQDADLAKPVDWGVFEARMFKTLETKVKFSLQTSWIPGEDRKGMFRYKMLAGPDTPDSLSPEALAMLVERIHGCVIRLNLYDVDGFVLRALPIPFAYGVDDKARLQNLVANTSSPMDANEYRQFIGPQNKSGSWSVSWDCGSAQ